MMSPQGGVWHADHQDVLLHQATCTGLGVRRASPESEYQRGAAWSLAQKQALIDSAFRRYPIPPLFLEKKVTKGALGGGESVKYEVVDGQQRLLAFREYYADQYLLASQDKRLRLPTSLRSAPVLGQEEVRRPRSDLRTQLDETSIDVFELENVEIPIRSAISSSGFSPGPPSPGSRSGCMARKRRAYIELPANFHIDPQLPYSG